MWVGNVAGHSPPSRGETFHNSTECIFCALIIWEDAWPCFWRARLVCSGFHLCQSLCISHTAWLSGGIHLWRDYRNLTLYSRGRLGSLTSGIPLWTFYWDFFMNKESYLLNFGQWDSLPSTEISLTNLSLYHTKIYLAFYHLSSLSSSWTQ